VFNKSLNKALHKTGIIFFGEINANHLVKNLLIFKEGEDKNNNLDKNNLEIKLNVLFDQFKQIVNESLINLHLVKNTTTSTTNGHLYTIVKNLNLETKFQVFRK